MPVSLRRTGLGRMSPKKLIAIPDDDFAAQLGVEKPGLLRDSEHYDPTRYAWAYDYWLKQQQVHWLVSEILFGEDVKDWASDRVTAADRSLLTQIFRFFTQSDVEVTDNYLDRYVPVFRPLSVKMMMAAFTNMETVHIDAYAKLLTTIGMPEAEFRAFRDYAEMREKADYMKTFGIDTCSDVSRTLAMFGGFTEGMALFASFAILLNFPRFGKMKGMGQVITWSVRDESLHCAGVTDLFHAWNAETGALTKSVKDDIADVGKTMVGLEDRFVDLAFALGPVDGLTPEDVKAYVRYIADWRFLGLRLPPVYGNFDADGRPAKEHPLPWLRDMLATVEHANFFEQRSTEYSKGATRGSWDDVWAKFDARRARAAAEEGAP